MITPLPETHHTYICVICYTQPAAKKCAAKWVNHRGHALCDKHREYTTHHLVTGVLR